MGDMGEVFREMQKEKQERHAKWHKENRELIQKSGIPFTDRGEALLFRFSTVKADFYPSTGRWRAHSKTFKGGAKAFLGWLVNRLPMRPGQKWESTQAFHEQAKGTCCESH